MESSGVPSFDCISWGRAISNGPCELAFEIIGSGRETSAGLCEFDYGIFMTPLFEIIGTTEQKEKSSEVLKAYVRWGGNRCSHVSTLLYQGVVVGTSNIQRSSGATYLCLPETPILHNRKSGKPTITTETFTNYLYGTLISSRPTTTSTFPNSSYKPGPMPETITPRGLCSVCAAQNKRNVITVPGRSECPGAYFLEYSGFMRAQHKGRKRTQYMCVDSGSTSSNTWSYGRGKKKFGMPMRALTSLNYVEKQCGVLGCRGRAKGYREGFPLPCVVCSK